MGIMKQWLVCHSVLVTTVGAVGLTATPACATPQVYASDLPSQPIERSSDSSGGGVSQSPRTTPAPSRKTGNQAAAPVDEIAGLEEIIITARRTAERLQDVPAAVFAISADIIVEQGIRSDADLQAAIPGLVIRTAGTTNFISYVMRGQSLDQYSGAVPGVQPYVNEVPFMANAALSFYDLDGIQVLKGPQGTLFGRNLTGGAVLYQTAVPNENSKSYLSVAYGNLDRLVAEGAINIPVNEAVALRLAGTHTSGGAFIKNLYDGRMYGDKDYDSGRLSLILKPTDRLTSTTVAEATDSGGTNQPNFPYYVLPCGTQGGDKACNLNPSVPAFQTLINSAPGTYYPGYPGGYVFPGGLAELPGFLRSRGRYVVDSNAPFDHDADYFYVQNTTEYEISSDITIKNIVGYSKSDAEDFFDNDASPYITIDPGLDMPGSTQNYRAKSRQLSDELQLNGKALDERLKYLAGLFYVSTRNDIDSAFRMLFIFPPDILYPIAIRFHGITEDVSYAAFGQTTFAVTDRLNVTGGLRWTWDKLTTYHLEDSLFYTGGTRQEAWEDKPSWTVSIDYDLSPDLMIYATTRGSWRVGGYNLFAPQVGDKLTAEFGGNYFLPETVRDVEVGTKFNGRIGTMPASLNVAAYYQWMKDVQRTGLGIIDGVGASATVTVGSAEVGGIETDFQILPTDWLRLGGSYAYTDARFVDNVGVLYGIPALFGPYADAPRHAGSLFGEITAPLPDNMGVLTFRVDGYAQSYFYFSNRARTFDPGTKIPGYTLINMRLDWQDPIGIEGLTVSAFAKNLMDKPYWTGGAPGAQVAGLVSASFGPPRTYGVGFRFGW
ncbi:MAG: hypothetical protein EPO21_07400 [Chloroflexota bacterium]|nr:MAG: hypothetical protein EPO21_07400 [Chloroflexota bacterium]